MRTVQQLTYRKGGREGTAQFSGGWWLASSDGPGHRLLDLPAYFQRDAHCCAFLAALSVIRFFRPEVEPARVLELVQPTAQGGAPRGRIVRALHRFGIAVQAEERLQAGDLLRHLRKGRPVIVGVWPAHYLSDHWTVVRGLDRRIDRVYLINHGWRATYRGVSWEEFAAAWWPYGAGLVCQGQ